MTHEAQFAAFLDTLNVTQAKEWRESNYKNDHFNFLVREHLGEDFNHNKISFAYTQVVDRFMLILMAHWAAFLCALTLDQAKAWDANDEKFCYVDYNILSPRDFDVTDWTVDVVEARFMAMLSVDKSK